ncbi:hypothetical protein NEOC95_000933 [Neochlamydia sp. AcF95]|nr:hypothetical protein [Neochlamydia sp. AcF95]
MLLSSPNFNHPYPQILFSPEKVITVKLYRYLSRM